MPRISIFMVMLAVCAFAAGLAALKVNSAAWESIASAACLALLATSTLMSVVARGRARTAWLGCAVFGWTHFLVGLWPAPNDASMPPRTTAFLDEMIPYLNPGLDATIKKAAPFGIKEYSRMSSTNATELGRYRRVSRLLMTLVFAASGGLVGSAVGGQGRRLEGHAEELVPPSG